MYAAIANGGTIWKPTIAKAIVKTDGKVVKTFKPEKLGELGVDATTISFLHDALHEVTISGTSAGAFAGFPVATAGKTGTAQVFGRNANGTAKSDTAWYASFAPATNSRYAVVMMVSQGGFGAGTSAVGVRKIYETIFGVKGSTVNPDLAVFPSGTPPTKLPRISPATKPKPSILNPGSAKAAVSATPTPTAKAKVKR
jgi:penicillin-binding protein 2